LLLGPVGTGKTVLFYQLLKGAFVETHTSMKENAKRFIPHALLSSAVPQPFASQYIVRIIHIDVFSIAQSKSIEFVDFPGHGSHRHKLHSKIASSRVVVLI
jgi:signal recognition particle receptor subunit beta